MNSKLNIQGPEQMSILCMPSDAGHAVQIVRIRDVLGMIHLILVDKNIFIVNDRKDLTTWNDLS